MKHLILGLDPGSRHTGLGLIEADGDDLRPLYFSTINLHESWSLPERLKVLQAELHTIYSRYEIHCTVVERIFMAKNADSAFKLGHARGVALMVSAQHGVAVEEYATRSVKKALTGTGAASKELVQQMVLRLLRLPDRQIGFDASDALALAIAHSRLIGINSQMKKQLKTIRDKDL